MKTAELRVNNYYQSVKFNCPVKCEISDLVEIYHRADGAEIGQDDIATLFSPIPLTEDWLIKFGCIRQRINRTKKNYWNKQMDFSVDVEYTFVGEELLYYYLVHNQDRRKNIMHVHQLQNL